MPESRYSTHNGHRYTETPQGRYITMKKTVYMYERKGPRKNQVGYGLRVAGSAGRTVTQKHKREDQSPSACNTRLRVAVWRRVTSPALSVVSRVVSVFD